MNLAFQGSSKYLVVLSLLCAVYHKNDVKELTWDGSIISCPEAFVASIVLYQRLRPET